MISCLISLTIRENCFWIAHAGRKTAEEMYFVYIMVCLWLDSLCHHF